MARVPMTNEITFPVAPQPKQLYELLDSRTKKEGVLSEWNGQSPVYVIPLRRKETVSATTSTMLASTLTRSMLSFEITEESVAHAARNENSVEMWRTVVCGTPLPELQRGRYPLTDGSKRIMAPWHSL